MHMWPGQTGFKRHKIIFDIQLLIFFGNQTRAIPVADFVYFVNNADSTVGLTICWNKNCKFVLAFSYLCLSYLNVFYTIEVPPHKIYKKNLKHVHICTGFIF